MDAIVIVQPETVIRWHRRGFRAYWHWKSRHVGGCPQIDSTAIELARSGRLGEPRVFTSLFVEPIPPGDVRLRKGAGPLDYIGVYCLNAARHLFADEPEEAFALAGSDGSDRFREVEETASAILRFPPGRVATFVAASIPPTAPTSA